METEVDPLLGVVLDGRYELTEFIAAGGMGRVYKGVQLTLNREVAVKLLKDFSDGVDEFQRRFFLEASLCARLTHPSTIRIFDYGCHEAETFYIVMEHLQGQSLKDVIMDVGAMSPLRAVGAVRQACAALVEAHEAALVHRDLKPSNLFVCPDGLGGDFVKILDFGVVKQMSVDMQITQVQTTMGSPQYMSPEQVRSSEVDGRSDLYSLGVILFQLLTGRVPFSGTEVMEVVLKHITDPVPSMREVNPRIVVPPSVEAIVQRAMQKSAVDRYANAREMLVALIEAEMLLGGGNSSSNDVVALELAKNLSLMEMPTGVLDIEPVESLYGGDSPEDTDTVPLDTTFEVLRNMTLEGYRAFIDLNCPYCYAMFERITRWGLGEQIEWCMVEHDAHVLEGPFDLNQEELLTTEVFEVHHRAPDVDLRLPPDRCNSTMATWLVVMVCRLFPDSANTFRRAVYRALWHDGWNIGDRAILEDLLHLNGLPAELLEMCEEAPEEFLIWQKAWDMGPYDHSIPVLTHVPTDRVLIGLADERTLAAFLLGERARVVDSTVCFYQQRPTILLCGWMSHVWALLEDVRDLCEIIQAPTARRASEVIGENAVPELLVVEGGHVSSSELADLGMLARSRAIPWVLATSNPSPEEEIDALSAGAVEYLPVEGESKVARVRLERILRDRYDFASQKRYAPTDALTGLPTRRILLERLEEEWSRAERGSEELSLIMINLEAFKAYNKAHGYLCGDRCLKEISKRFGRMVRHTGNLLVRFSGNEFAVLMPATSQEEANAFATRMVDEWERVGEQNRTDAAEGLLRVTEGVSTIVPYSTNSMHDLIDEAHRELRSRRG
jgi:diguanylate cyclase (GGDEF)-like protein